MIQSKVNTAFIFFNLISHIRLSDLLRLKNEDRYTPGIVSTKIGKLNYVDPVTFLKGYQEIFLNEIYEVEGFTNNQPVIIDCGANIGLASIFFGKKYKAKVYAYEADPIIFEALTKNIDHLDLGDEIRAFNKAIWVDDEGVEFEIEGGYSGQVVRDPSKNINQSINVATIRLKDVLMKFDHIDFLKIDIEGAENEIIFDCNGLLSKIPYIFIEYHSFENDNQKLGELLNLLKAEGFRYQLKEAFNSKHPFKKVETMMGMDLQLNIFAYKELL